LARQLGLDYAQIQHFLNLLHKENILEYIPRSEHPQITYLKPRLRDNQLSFDHLKYKKQKTIRLEKARAMTALLQSQNCRQQIIMHYFGQIQNQPCGFCDRCIIKKGKSENIQEIISTIEALPSETILNDDVDASAMTFLLERGLIYRFGHQYKRR